MKKYLLGIGALVIALAMVSFKQTQHAQTDTFYYQYLGSTTKLADYKDPDNWAGPISQGSANCSSNNLPCEVMSTIGSKSSFVTSINDESVVDNHVSSRKP
ncbi:MAG TPA: hypothetical protein VEV15_13805 [Flavisolibacter sp.]|nr:hypothetical protein [Flavisolibacter sp.]